MNLKYEKFLKILWELFSGIFTSIFEKDRFHSRQRESASRKISGNFDESYVSGT